MHYPFACPHCNASNSPHDDWLWDDYQFEYPNWSQPITCSHCDRYVRIKPHDNDNGFDVIKVTIDIEWGLDDDGTPTGIANIRDDLNTF